MRMFSYIRRSPSELNQQPIGEWEEGLGDEWWWRQWWWFGGTRFPSLGYYYGLYFFWLQAFTTGRDSLTEMRSLRWLLEGWVLTYTLRYPWGSFLFAFYFLLVFLFPSSPHLLLNWFSLGLSFFFFCCSLSPFVFQCVTTIRDIITYHIFALGILFCNFLFYFTRRHIYVRVLKCHSSCVFYCLSCSGILGLYKGSASTRSIQVKKKTWSEIQREYI